MGDLARQELGEKFVAEFADELLEKYKLNAHWIIRQYVEYDADHCVVRLFVLVREDSNDETLLVMPSELFDCAMTEEDTVDALVAMLVPEDPDVPPEYEDRVASIRVRVKKVFS